MNIVHGEYSLMLASNIMFVVARGPWNVECVDKFRQDYKTLRIPIEDQRRGDLVVLHGD